MNLCTFAAGIARDFSPLIPHPLLRKGEGELLREQRQIFLAADAVEATRGPQRFAPVEAERAEGVEIGETFDGGGGQAAAQPDVAHRVVAAAAPLHELAQLYFLE